MADIIDLIAQQGKGGQTYPARMAQMAQARETEQRTQDMSKLRQQQAETQQRNLDRQTQLDDIARSSTTTEEWMGKLKAAGRHQEYMETKEFANKLSEQTKNIDKLDRDKAKEEAQFFSNLFADVKDQSGQDKAMRIFKEKYPNSDADDFVNPTYDPEMVRMYRLSGMSISESIDLQKQQEKQGRTEQLKQLGGVMENATDKESYTASRNLFIKLNPNSPLVDILPEEYDPEFVSGLSNVSKTAHQVALEGISKEKVAVQREKIQLTRQDRILKNRKFAAQYREQVVSDTELLKRLEDTSKLIKENRTSVGAVGALKGSVAGFVGQFGAPGRWAETLVQSEEDIQVHSGIALLDGVLIPRVLNDTSGRYSDADMDRVREINSGREWMKSPRQTLEMMDRLMEITKRGRDNAQRMIDDPAYDPNYPTKEEPETKTPTGKKSKFSVLWDE